MKKAVDKTTQKHAGGRPLAFQSVEELQTKIDEYFAYCDNKTKEIHSEKLGDMIVPDPEPYTMSGLAVSLGIDRRTLLNYESKDEFFPTIKKAKARVEADLDRRMNTKETFTPGNIFTAKNNFGWKEEGKTTNVQVNNFIPLLGGDSIKHALPENDSD